MNKTTHTHTHKYLFQSTPCGFQPLGEFGETLPKSACWAGDYNTVLPTESQEPAKSCLGLHPPHFFLLFPSALSVSDSLFESLVLFSSPPFTSLNHFSPCPPLPSCSSSIPCIFDTRPLSFLCFPAPTTPLLSPLKQREKQGEEEHRKKKSRWMALYWRGGKQINTDSLKLIRNPHWQRLVG